jgi:hypothetical protein
VRLKEDRKARQGTHATTSQSIASFPDFEVLAATSMDRDAWQMLAGHLIIAGLSRRDGAGRQDTTPEATPASRLRKLLRWRPQGT